MGASSRKASREAELSRHDAGNGHAARNGAADSKAARKAAKAERGNGKSERKKGAAARARHRVAAYPADELQP